MKNRRDLRDLFICSVDPPGCTDIDDALHCRKLENGHLEVSHWKSRNSCGKVDEIAYLGVDMQPCVLSRCDAGGKLA